MKIKTKTKILPNIHFKNQQTKKYSENEAKKKTNNNNGEENIWL